METGNRSQSSTSSVFVTGNPTTDRFVIFLDIMGFKDRVARQDHQQILRDLQNLSNFISEKLLREEGFIFTMFSDSIIILSSDVEYKTFEKLVDLTNAVIAYSISLNLPIKGAFARGKCTAISGGKSLYFGQPIIDAYALEENVELYNVVLHHTVEDYAIQLSAETGKVFDYQVGEGRKVNFSTEYANGSLTKLNAIYNDEDFEDLFEICKKIVSNMQNSSQVLEYSALVLKYKSKIQMFLEILQSLYKDMLLVKLGKTSFVQNKDFMNGLLVLSNGVNQLAITKILEEIQSINQKLIYNANINGVVDNLLLKILEIKFLCK